MRRPAAADRLFHRLFETSLLLKGLFAAAEFLLGLALWFVSAGTLATLVRALTAHELAEDPADPLARFLLTQAEGFGAGVEHFYAFYLASHGALKLLMVGLLMREVAWAFPAGVAILSGFIVYQIALLSSGVTAGLVLLTLLDLAVLALTLREWRKVRRGG